MSIRITQAFMLFAATHTWTDKVTSLEINEYGVPSTYLHAWANQDDNCTSYDSYKHLTERERVNEFLSALDGGGAYGFWSFADGSKLIIASGVALTGKDRLVLLQPESPSMKVGETHPATLVDLTNWPEIREERLELYDSDAGQG